MTTNQTIDGVPRKLVRENIAYLRGVGGTYDQKSALAAKFELLLLDPAPPKELREQYEAWADANGYDITRNEHGDYAGIVEDSMWTGWQARGELRALLDAAESATCAKSQVEGRRERFQKWVMATKHPVFGFLDGRSLARGDDRTGYADEYVQGLWVAYLEFGAEQAAPVAVVQFCGLNVAEDPSTPPGQIRMCNCNQGRCKS